MARRLVSVLQAVRLASPELIDPEEAIRAGCVRVDGVVHTNLRTVVRASASVAIVPPTSLRGEAKLRAALERFAVKAVGRVALDVGAAAGGFTKVLLESGARRVYAVDAGHGQLLGSLRQDPRVVNLERTNLGELSRALVPEPIDIFTVDVSYLSLTVAVPQLCRVEVAASADLVALVKPMFELRLGSLPDAPALLAEALDTAIRGIEAGGWWVVDSMPSPVRGAHGAVEMLVHAQRERSPAGR